jgi:hypothetical protein
MNKFLLSLLVLCSFSFSQTSFPPLTQLPLANVSRVVQTIVIGDYDGDGTNDILVEFNAGDSNSINTYAIAIYSYTKETYLLQLNIGYTSTPLISYGDVNNDKKVEVIIGNKIYAYNSSLVKKKI